VIGGQESELFELGEVMVEVDGCSPVSSRVMEFELSQAVDQEGGMGWLVDDG